MTSQHDRSGLLAAIDAFVSGHDRSVICAGEIEVMLDESYPDGAFLQDVVVMLASYRPGGGDHLYDEEALRRTLTIARARIADSEAP